MKGQCQLLPVTLLVLLFADLFYGTSFISAQDSAEEASPIYYEKPSHARLSTAASKQLHKVCVYNKQKYLSGEEVKTEQPCLRCTCKKGVLLCALRVCPPVTAGNLSAPASRCQVVREPNTCCPTVQCVPSPHDDRNGYSATNEISSNVKSVTTVTPLISLQSSLFIADLDRDGSNRSEEASKSSHMVSVTHLLSRNTTILQTVPSSSFPDKHHYGNYGNSPFVSRLSLHHSHQPSKESYVSDLLNGFGKYCYINGTFYAEGSAIMSSSFCEYCYCIRGKRMCIRPRCHLSILGCLPRYTSEYACCPTSYACGDDALSTPSSNITSTSNGKWSLFYAFDEKLIGDSQESNATTNSPFVAEQDTTNGSSPNSNLNSEWSTSVPSLEELSDTTISIQITTQVPEKLPNKIGTASRMTGDPMPGDGNCRHCFCAVDGTRICNAIHCSLHIGHHCTPVIPEGHCCPIEYKCGSDSLTKSASNNSLAIELTSKVKNDSQQVVKSSEQVNTVSNNSIEQSVDNVKDQIDSNEVTTELNMKEVTTMKTVDIEKENVGTSTEIKVFSLFPTEDLDNETILGTNASSHLNESVDLVADQFRWNKSNATNEFDSVVNSVAPSTLEARNWSDEPKPQEHLNEPKNESKAIDQNNSNVGSIKLGNVAHFFNNIFNVLGLSTKNGIDSRVHPVNKHIETSIDKTVPKSVLFVADYSPLITLSSNDQIEIVTDLPSPIAAQKNHFERPVTPSAQNHQSVQLMPSVALDNVNSHDDTNNHHTEALKQSIRELPHGATNHLSKNIPLDRNNHNLHTFSNGWRAIPNLKNKPKPSLQVSFEHRPNLGDNKNESATKTDSASTVATTIKAEASSEEYENKQNSLETIVESNQTNANIDINKAKCTFEGKEYENGAILPKSNDPCVYCRCFYGKEICQEQKCPLPPSLGCVAERVANQCCPVFTCGMTANLTKNELTAAKVQDNLVEKSTIRRGPQYQPEMRIELNKMNDVAMNNDILVKSRFEADQSNGPVTLNKPQTPSTSSSFQHGQPNQPRISFPFDPLPRPLDLVYGSRVHFPPNKHINLPPNLSPGLILNLNKPFMNRPIYGSLPNGFKPNQKVDEIRGGQTAPIRPIPQSPTQMEKPKAPEEVKVSHKPRPAVVSTEPTLGSSSTEQSTHRQHHITTTIPSGPWDILQVSGCNIYGKMYKINEEIGQLNSDCKKCICSSHGVQCKEIC